MIEDLHDMGALDLRGRRRLAPEPRDELVILRGDRRHELDRDLRRPGEVVRHPNAPHGPCPRGRTSLSAGVICCPATNPVPHSSSPGPQLARSGADGTPMPPEGRNFCSPGHPCRPAILVR